MKILITLLLLAVAAPALADECSTSVFFETSKWNLSADAKKSLDKVLPCATNKQAVKVAIVGNADPRPFNTNQKLSLRRADSVRAYLVKAGVHADLISVTANGDLKQVCTENTKECLAKNRRADVLVTVAVPPPPVVCATCPTCPPAPVPVVVTKTVTVEKIVEVEKASPWEIMAYAQFGAHLTTNGYPSTLPTQTNLHGSFNNWGVWNVGTEFHLVPYRLGLRTAVGNNGISGMVQVFPVQGRLNWYIGAGGAYTQYPFYRPSVPYVQRYFDVQVGTGVEYAFTDHIIGLADLKASVPMPWTNAPNLTWYDVGQSFKQTSLLVGVGYRF